MAAQRKRIKRNIRKLPDILYLRGQYRAGKNPADWEPGMCDGKREGRKAKNKGRLEEVRVRKEGRKTRRKVRWRNIVRV